MQPTTLTSTETPCTTQEQDILMVDNISKAFPLSSKQRKIEHTTLRRKQAVTEVSFAVHRGEIFGLLGPNGAGKTTTLRILSTLIKPDRGEVLLDGISVVQYPEAIRSRIGFLSSELKLEDFFTPNYLYNFFSRLHQVPPQVARTRKEELFARFGIDKFAEVKVANLSTGMKQKLSIVISLVHDPEVIIFDEPTNGLDVLTAHTVVAFLQEKCKEGKTIILSTHIFNLVERLCHRVGIIIDGRMVCCDTLSHVCQGLPLEDRFFELYEHIHHSQQ